MKLVELVSNMMLGAGFACMITFGGAILYTKGEEIYENYKKSHTYTKSPTIAIYEEIQKSKHISTAEIEDNVKRCFSEKNQIAFYADIGRNYRGIPSGICYDRDGAVKYTFCQWKSTGDWSRAYNERC
jgi:hypothetical protein